MAKVLAFLVAALVARAPAAAQQPGGASGQQGTTDDALERACVDLLAGRTPGAPGEDDALRRSCARLIDARARAPQQQALAPPPLQQGGTGSGQAEAPPAGPQPAQPAQPAPPAGAQPGQSTREPQQGTGVLAAFDEAGRELFGRGDRPKSLGSISAGPVMNTLVTNPVGWFTGLGVNAELYRVLAPRVSWVAGARYSSTNATNGTATTFGVMGGVDLFAIGRNNEGLRFGPRLELAVGSEDFQGRTTFARVGLAGELGYNFIATNGITGLLAGGFGGRILGDNKNDSFAGFTGGEAGPYVKIGLGYSW